MKMKSDRKAYIDFLKVIGIMAIILAHVSPPSIILQMRNFDVPLMVMISGYLAACSYNGDGLKEKRYQWRYIKKRILRLLAPTWIFFTFYFLIMHIWGLENNTPQMILKTYLLQHDSIGYVWVIWVYLMCAVAVPFLINKPLTEKKYIFYAICSYIIFEICCRIRLGIEARLVYTTIYFIIPYGILLWIGMNFRQFSLKWKTTVFYISITIYVIMAAYLYMQTGKVVPIQDYKYPPRLYYLSYGLAVSSGLFLLVENKNLKLFDNKLVDLISSSSMWIYLWHILYLRIIVYCFHSIWITRYVSIIVLSTVTVAIQRKIVLYLKTKGLPKEVCKIFL